MTLAIPSGFRKSGVKDAKIRVKVLMDGTEGFLREHCVFLRLGCIQYER